MRRAKLNENNIELFAKLSDSDLIAESLDDSNTDRTWKPKNLQNVVDSDFLDSDGD